MAHGQVMPATLLHWIQEIRQMITRMRIESGDRINQGAYGNTVQASKSGFETVQWTGNTSTAWGTASNWSSNSVPIITDHVIIPSSATFWPTYSGNLTIGTTCGDITMEGSSQLTVTGNLTINSGTSLNCNASANIRVGGNWSNSGTFNRGTGTLNFNGSAASNIIGSETFYNLTISNTSDIVTASSDITINNLLTIAPNASFTVNGMLTNNNGENGILIQSDASGTGSLLHNTDGVPATVERHLNHGIGDAEWYYHQTCAPIDGATLYDFNLHPGYTYAYEYLPSADGLPPTQSNLINIHDGSSSIDPMKGILMSTYYNIVDVTANFTGTLQNGNMSTPVSSGMTSLIGNPYPSAINWDNLNDQAGIYDRVYIWSPADGNFAVYVEGSGGNESCRYIQVGQSFFVESSTASSFSFSNNDRVQHHATYLKNPESETPNYLILETSGGNYTSDKAYIRFNQGGDEMYDENQEAKKVFSIYPDEATELYTVSSDNVKLTINTMPELSDKRSV